MQTLIALDMLELTSLRRFSSASVNLTVTVLVLVGTIVTIFFVAAAIICLSY